MDFSRQEHWGDHSSEQIKTFLGNALMRYHLNRLQPQRNVPALLAQQGGVRSPCPRTLLLWSRGGQEAQSPVVCISPGWRAGRQGRAANVNTDGTHFRMEQAAFTNAPSAPAGVTKDQAFDSCTALSVSQNLLKSVALPEMFSRCICMLWLAQSPPRPRPRRARELEGL